MEKQGENNQNDLRKPTGTIRNKTLRKTTNKMERPGTFKDMQKMRLEEEDARERERWWRVVGEVKYQFGYKWPRGSK